MVYRWAADLVVVIHALFVVFVVAGGLLVLRWRRLAWLHLPAAAWGAMIEFGNWICPLTPLEKRLRALGGQGGYEGGFIENYLVPVLYPEGLTRGMQIALGSAVIVLNLAIYGGLLLHGRRSGAAEGPRDVAGGGRGGVRRQAGG